jgi:hypothetical protein
MESKKYISKYSNNKPVSSAQYITEIICERKAAKDKQDLHYRFWISKEWSKFFRNQIGSANKLLKQYSDKAIVAALLSTDGQKIYSLRAPHLPDMIVREQTRLDQQNQTMTKHVDRKNDIIFGSKNTQSHKNIISRIKDLDK